MSDFTIPSADSSVSYAPVSLYQWTRGSVQYNYCSADQDITYNGITYTALPITDSGFTQSGESSDDDVKVTLPWSAAVAQLYIGTAPSDEVFLRIYRMGFNDPVARLSWTGSIIEVTRTDYATCEINHQTLAQSFERDGLTLAYSRNCPFFLYDPTTCKVNPALYQTVTTVEAVIGSTIVSDDFARYGDQYFAGGYVEWVISGTDDTFERRPIYQQIGNQIVLMGVADGITAGQAINAYPGCDRSTSTCKSKFDNIANNGSSPFLPGINPFDSVNIF